MSRGVRGFVSEILPGNTSMLRLAASAQGTMTTSRDEDAVHMTVLFPDSSSTASTVLFEEGSSLNAAGIQLQDPEGCSSHRFSRTAQDALRYRSLTGEERTWCASLCSEPDSRVYGPP